MGELIKNGFAYMINLSYVKQIKNTKLRHSLKEKKFKIIAFEISSRHKRSKVKSVSKKDPKTIEKYRTSYKIFILYEPNIDSYKSIKCNYTNIQRCSFICNLTS